MAKTVENGPENRVVIIRASPSADLVLGSGCLLL